MKSMTTETVRLTIHAMGGLGDGIASHEGQQVFVPFACVGDEVRVALSASGKPGQPLRAELLEVVKPSPKRQPAPCRHFGTCGGCALQHMKPDAYRQFKQQFLRKLLDDMGVDPAIILPMVEVGAQSRRRAEFKISVRKGVVKMGFFASQSHRLVPLEECQICDPRLMALLPIFQACLAGLKKPGRILALHVTLLEAGVDATLMVSKSLTEGDRQSIRQFARSNPLVRVSEQHSGEGQELLSPRILHDTQQAKISLGGVSVALPVGAFLQATEAGQEAITRQVLQHLQGCKAVLDLYAGCGTYSFPLAGQVERVSAFEASVEMIAAMHNALMGQGLEGRMQASARDLVQSPLAVQELQGFDGMVINPPRSGALPQVKMIARSQLPRLVMVSCNPLTFQRDATILLNSGYRLTELLPIDQFYWSSHLELVASFEK
jgi:23S rRNA (uracil1939-C5)-methyltransferase